MDWADEASPRSRRPRTRRSSTTRRRRQAPSTSAACAGRRPATRSAARSAPTTSRRRFCYGVDDLDPMDAQALLTPDAVERYMGVPLAHVPAPPGTATRATRATSPACSSTRSPASASTRTALLDERASTRPATWIRTSATALDRADVVRDIYRRVANVEHPAGWLPISRHLRELRPDRHDDRDRLGRRDGRVHFECRGSRRLGARLRHDRAVSPVRRPRQAALERRLGRPVGRSSASRSRAAARTSRRPAARATAAMPSPRGLRARAAAQRPLRVPEHRRPQDVAPRRGAGAAAHEIADVLPPELLRFLFLRHTPEPGDRVRPRRRHDPAPVRRVRPDRRRDRRPARSGRAAAGPRGGCSR